MLNDIAFQTIYNDWQYYQDYQEGVALVESYLLHHENKFLLKEGIGSWISGKIEDYKNWKTGKFKGVVETALNKIISLGDFVRKLALTEKWKKVIDPIIGRIQWKRLKLFLKVFQKEKWLKIGALVIEFVWSKIVSLGASTLLGAIGTATGIGSGAALVASAINIKIVKDIFEWLTSFCDPEKIFDFIKGIVKTTSSLKDADESLQSSLGLVGDISQNLRELQSDLQSTPVS